VTAMTCFVTGDDRSQFISGMSRKIGTKSSTSSSTRSRGLNLAALSIVSRATTCEVDVLREKQQRVMDVCSVPVW